MRQKPKRGPGRPPKTAAGALDAGVLVRVSRERREVYEAAARAEGTTLADEARRAWERLARRAER